MGTRMAVRRSGWTPPIGIPDPGFGILDAVPAVPSPWTSVVTGFYYVDNTHGSATDNSNPNGRPGQPRVTIPDTLPAGAVCKVAGGPYLYNTSFSTPNVTANGTAEAFVYLHGIPDGSGNLPCIQAPGVPADYGANNGRSLNMGGTYWVVDGFTFCNGTVLCLILMGHHGVVRNCRIFNFQLFPAQYPYDAGGSYPNQGPAAAMGNSPTVQIHDMVIYNNVFSDTGDYLAPHDNKMQGIKMTGVTGTPGSYNIWVLNNLFFHNGQAMQWGDDAIGTFEQPGNVFTPDEAAFMHHLYIGFNECHHDREVGIALKMIKDVVVSQNKVHGYIDMPAGTLCQGDAPAPEGGPPTLTALNTGRYCPDYVWTIFNEVWDASQGVRCESTAEADSGTAPIQSHFYAIGNIIHDIVGTEAAPDGPHCAPYNAIDPASSGAGMMGRSVNFAYFVDNTLVTSAKGITCASTGYYEVTGNLLKNCGDPMNLVPTGFGTNVFNRNFYEGTARLCLSSASTIISLAAMQGNGFETNSLQGASLIDAAYKPAAGSPVIGANTRSGVYAAFFARYGISIEYDFYRKPRPSNGIWAIGAVEP